MNINIKKEEKGLMEIEFEDKVMANALLAELLKKDVDAYAKENHPLLPGYVLHVEAKDAKKAVKTAIADLEKDWKALKSAVQKAIK